jgi:ankyrin repeat protein
MDWEKQVQAIKQLIVLDIELSNEQLVEYIKQGKVELVKLFLTAGINPNVKVSKGFAAVIADIIKDTPIFIDENDMPMELTDETEKNVTPLLWAAAFNQLELCRILLESGAVLYARDTYGVTALEIACAIGALELVKLLIDNGAEIGLEPLDWAVRQGHLDVVKELIAQGANIKERKKDETTVLSTAIYHRHLEIAKYLIELGLNIKDEWNCLGETLLTTAIRSWDPETVKFVIEQGADVNERDKESGKTALFSAAWIGNTETAKVLVQYGTRLDIRDNQGQTVLEYAIENKKERFVQFLKSVGAKE